MNGLGQNGVLAVKWSVVFTVGRFLLQMAAQVVLARTLGPELFGVFAIGLVVFTFSTFVSSFGFSWSLLQRTTLQDEDIRFALTWQLLVGIVAMLALYFLAPALAIYFKEPRAQSVIEWMSVACLLTAAASPATYLLQRDLNFRASGLIQVVSYAVGYLIVGVPMALLGWGTTSLVTAWLVQAAALLVFSYALKPHPLRLLFWYSGAASAFGTGRAVFLTNIVNWFLNNLDRIVIGRLLNAQSLGLYNVAYNLATLPNTILLGSLQPAFLAAGARLQNDLQRLGQAYQQMLATVFVLGLPAFVFLALIAADLVRFLYGPQWNEAGWVMGILLLGMPAYVVWGLSTPVLWNTGRKHYEFVLQLPILLLGVLGFYMFASQGIRTAAVIAVLLLVLRAIVIGSAAIHALKLSWTTLLPHVGRGLLLSILCAAGVLAGQKLVAHFNIPLLSITAGSVASLSILLLLIVVRPQLLGDHTIAMIIRFFPRLANLLNKASREPTSQTLGEHRL